MVSLRSGVLRLFMPILLALLVGGLAAAVARGQEGPALGFHVGRGNAQHMDAVREAGGDFAVVVFSWEDIEPVPGRFYWEQPDAALRAGDYFGVEVIARLDRPPAWARTAEGLAPWDAGAYATFAARVADRYGDRLAGVILWNEPNLSLEWAGQAPDPKGYVELIRAAYPAIKAVAPRLPVALAGLACTGGDGDRATGDLAYLQALYDAGAAPYFDVLASHPYGFGRPPAQAPAASQLNFRRVELQREIMAANGDEEKPVWITEMGWRTSAAEPAEAWQVVTPEQQAAYTLAALDYAAANYPWLARIGLWELNGAGDDYGYGLWHGPEARSAAYDALVARARQGDQGDQAGGASPAGQAERNPAPAGTTPATVAGLGTTATGREAAVEILAPDVAIRLGDIGTLHPHWVHLHRGGERFSPDWRGEFFLTQDEAGQPWELLLETMQVDQPTNRVLINGEEIGLLRRRTRPDITSTWVTQRLEVPGGLLRPGANTLAVESGLRNPARQLADWRWENMQFRHARLVPPLAPAEPLELSWSALPSPAGWVEANRLRPGAAGEFWLTGNQPGSLWRGDRDGVENAAGDRPDLVFTDVLPLPAGELAATACGLWWRPAAADAWQAVQGAPEAYAYVVVQAGDDFYAAFEGRGLWRAAAPAGRWQPIALQRRTVLDAVVLANDQLAVATDAGVYLKGPGHGQPWRRLPAYPGQGDGPAGRFTSRLAAGAGSGGQLAAASHNRLWQWDGVGWQPYGPPGLIRSAAVDGCCGEAALVGTAGGEVWREEQGQWRRISEGTLEAQDLTALLPMQGYLVAAGEPALLWSRDGVSWKPIPGLPATATDLLVAPEDPALWLAGTPAGVYRSRDGGQSWQPAGPPWSVWDMAWGTPDEDGVRASRLFVARAVGLAWTDHPAAMPVAWQEANGLNGVHFFSVDPHPAEPGLVWAGTWGNNVAASQDNGGSVEPLHNGLETLSALDVLWHPTPGQATIATIEGLYRTDDGGESWFQLPGPLASQTVHSLLQTEDGAIWAGAADGLWMSPDYGASWSRITDLPVATVLRLGELALPDGQASWLWAGTEEGGLWLSPDRGATWRSGGLTGHTIYNLLLDPLQRDRVIAATERGLHAAPLPG